LFAGHLSPSVPHGAVEVGPEVGGGHLYSHFHCLGRHGGSLSDCHWAVRVVIALRKADTVADNMLAIDAILFLLACLAAYWALRTRSRRRMYLVERVADAVFIIALLLMVVICIFITFAIAVAPPT